MKFLLLLTTLTWTLPALSTTVEKYLSYIEDGRFTRMRSSLSSHQQENISTLINALGDHPEVKIPNMIITDILTDASPENQLNFGIKYLQQHRDSTIKFIDQINPNIPNDVTAIKNMIKFIIAEGIFGNDYEVLKKILLLDSSSIMIRLQRYVLFENFEKASLEEKMLFAASIHTTLSKRKSVLKKFEKANTSGDSNKLKQMVEEILLPAPPKGYSVDKYMIGSGKTSLVHLVTRESDGKKFAWKVPNTDSSSRSDTQKRQIDRSKLWSELEFGTETFVAPGGKSILQGYVKGQTLREMLNNKKRQNFLKTFDDTATFQLARLILEAVAQKVYISSVNYENLIFSGDHWYIIDGGEGKIKYTHRDTFTAWRDYSEKNWTRQSNYVHRDRVKEFFELVEKLLPELASEGIVTRKSVKDAVDKQKKYSSFDTSYSSSSRKTPADPELRSTSKPPKKKTSIPEEESPNTPTPPKKKNATKEKEDAPTEGEANSIFTICRDIFRFH